MRKRLSALTLIEALAIIVVIVILSAIGLATRQAHQLARAREDARRAACMENLMRMSKALESYAGDYSGYFPTSPPAGSEGTPL